MLRIMFLNPLIIKTSDLVSVALMINSRVSGILRNRPGSVNEHCIHLRVYSFPSF